jgi:hypothetical protein
VIALPYISYLYKGQIKIISNYIKKIEDVKKLPSLEEMLSKKK